MASQREPEAQSFIGKGEFEKQYMDLAKAAEDLAEQIRMLDFPAPGSYQSFARETSIEEANDDKVIAAKDMVRQLSRDNKTVIVTARKALRTAEEAGGDVTANLLVDRMQIHEKTAWMLRSFEC